MNWATFCEQFLKKYFPQAKWNKKEKEHLELMQGKISVREYSTQFERLSNFAYHMVDTPSKKNRKYQQGLSISLHKLTMSSINQSFEDLVGLVIKLEGIGNDREGKPTT